MSSESDAPKTRAFNGHTDGSAPLVSGFVDQTTGQQKDLSIRNPNPSLLVLETEAGQLNQVDGWDVERALAGGEKIVNMAAFLNPIDRKTGQFELPDKLLSTYMLHHARYDELLQKGDGKISEITSREDLNRVLQSSEIGMLRSVEGVYGEHTLQDIDTMIDKGVVIWDFMWNFDNPDTGKTASTSETPEDTGLTLKGKEFIRHLSVDRRVAVDLSHASDKTAMNVLDIAQLGVPAVATHSGFRELKPSKRNLTDDLAKRIAEQNGFIGIPFVKSFTGEDVEAVVDHIDYAASKLGIIDHIGLGPDFDGIVLPSRVAGLEDAEVAYRNIANSMQKRGFTSEQIDGVLFNNALRYMETYLFPAAK